MKILLLLMLTPLSNLHAWLCSAGGSDTVVGTLTWTLSLLLNNPHVMEKAQEELDIQVGRNTLVLDESHIRNLARPGRPAECLASCAGSETRRVSLWRFIFKPLVKNHYVCIHLPTALSVPHVAMEDCTIGGYNILKGTRVLLNLRKIQRDPTI
ncbi:demethylepipodophyllotoxin synthase-like [Solanum dulcamara]|uniref:demethylepipodophyllotoxin synthase-like n=1 Tax=Solanum dulcamara TaxID=45834 RepID=UPI0024851205|nr:demethylepipodophyllotoxin synthase-like [Solanum dulcamara]